MILVLLTIAFSHKRFSLLALLEKEEELVVHTESAPAEEKPADVESQPAEEKPSQVGAGFEK